MGNILTSPNSQPEKSRCARPKDEGGKGGRVEELIINTKGTEKVQALDGWCLEEKGKERNTIRPLAACPFLWYINLNYSSAARRSLLFIFHILLT